MKLFHVVSAAFLFGLVSVTMVGCSGGGDAQIDLPDPSAVPSEYAVFPLAASGDVSGVESLLASNPELINTRDDDGRTPLHYAAGNDQRKMVDFLLSKGADPLALDDNGEVPADAARQQGFTALDKVLTAAEGTAE